MKIDVKEPRSDYVKFNKGTPKTYYRKRECQDRCGINAKVCSSCDKIKNDDCMSLCTNERCARISGLLHGMSPYVDVCSYEELVMNDGRTVITRQPLPQVKTITAKRNVYNNSTNFKKQPYSYSITEMIRNQKTSYKEEQNKQNYYVNKMNRPCPPQNNEKWNKYANCVNGCN